jgi:hypothetical protein
MNVLIKEVVIMENVNVLKAGLEMIALLKSVLINAQTMEHAILLTILVNAIMVLANQIVVNIVALKIVTMLVIAIMENVSVKMDILGLNVNF